MNYTSITSSAVNICYKILLVVFYIFTISCEGDSQTKPAVTKTSEYKDVKIKDGYVPTGFYFLSVNSREGLSLKTRENETTYLISKKCFVCLENIDSISYKISAFGETQIPVINLSLNEEGINNVSQLTSTGNPFSFAVVVAGNLLFVPEVRSKITGKDFSIICDLYTLKEVESLVAAVKKEIK